MLNAKSYTLTTSRSRKRWPQFVYEKITDGLQYVKGVLFEGCFKAEHINEDRYLKYLFSYIHLNPVKLIDSKWKERGLKNLKQAKGFLRNYEYSSYLDYLGIERPQNKILNLSAFPNYFENIKDFWSEIFEWLSFGEDFSRQGPSLP